MNVKVPTNHDLRSARGWIRKRYWLPLIALLLCAPGHLQVNDSHWQGALWWCIAAGVWLQRVVRDGRLMLAFAQVAHGLGLRETNPYSSAIGTLPMFASRGPRWWFGYRAQDRDMGLVLALTGLRRGNQVVPKRQITAVLFEIPPEAAQRCSSLFVHPRRLDAGDVVHGIGSVVGLSGVVHVSTESTEFDRRYELWADAGSDPIARTELLNPAVLTQLIDHPGTYWEQRGAQLMLFREGWIRDRPALLALVEQAHQLRRLYCSLDGRSSARAAA